jgi:hypothetical protein
MDEWKFCAQTGSKPEACNFYARYGVAKESFEQVFWYYGAYGAMEGCILLLPGGILEAYFQDCVDDLFIGMIKGSWQKDDSTSQYILSFEKAAVAPGRGSCQPQLLPLDESGAWNRKMPRSIAISCDDSAPSGLPELNASKFLVGRYELGSRVLHGN